MPPEGGDPSAPPEPAANGAAETVGAQNDASEAPDPDGKADRAEPGEGPGLYPTAPGSERAATAYNDFEQLKLDVFEGPLDLLLHLIRKHELDILDIPVGFITEKYLEYIDLMRSLHIDVVSEYLVIAATLTHIKSKMLLPPDPSQQDGEDGELFEADPRADLVRRLLEYQKYRHVAGQLGDRPRLERDTFTRGADEPVDAGPTQLAPVNVFRLFDAFEQVLKRANQTADHQILFERVSLTERIVEITELLSTHRRMRFTELFAARLAGGNATDQTRLELVITFLALLEMCKMGVAKVTQDDGLDDLFVEFAARRQEGDTIPQAGESSDAAEDLNDGPGPDGPGPDGPGPDSPDLPAEASEPTADTGVEASEPDADTGVESEPDEGPTPQDDPPPTGGPTTPLGDLGDVSDDSETT